MTILMIYQSDVGPAAIMVGNLLQGARIASAQGRALPMSSEQEEQVRRREEEKEGD